MGEGRLNSYLLWRQEILVTHPNIIYMPHSAPICDIHDWVDIFKLDCLWHVSRYNVFDFQLGFDFFFSKLNEAAMFKLAWGGTIEHREPLQFQLFFID